jgi:hypothetical protein
LLAAIATAAGVLLYLLDRPTRKILAREPARTTDPEFATLEGNP